jgi:hypothetical protein
MLQVADRLRVMDVPPRVMWGADPFQKVMDGERLAWDPLVDPIFAGSRRRASNQPAPARPPRSSVRGWGASERQTRRSVPLYDVERPRRHAAIKGGRCASVAARTTVIRSCRIPGAGFPKEAL